MARVAIARTMAVRAWLFFLLALEAQLLRSERIYTQDLLQVDDKVRTEDGANTDTSALVYWSLFGENGPEMRDIRQGSLGDCWYLATLASIAGQHPEIIEQIFVNPGTVSEQSGLKVYQLKFLVDGVETLVALDEMVPMKNNKTQRGSQALVWSTSLEKWTFTNVIDVKANMVEVDLEGVDTLRCLQSHNPPTRRTIAQAPPQRRGASPAVTDYFRQWRWPAAQRHGNLSAAPHDTMGGAKMGTGTWLGCTDERSLKKLSTCDKLSHELITRFRMLNNYEELASGLEDSLFRPDLSSIGPPGAACGDLARADDPEQCDKFSVWGAISDIVE